MERARPGERIADRLGLSAPKRSRASDGLRAVADAWERSTSRSGVRVNVDGTSERW
jgi:hypothetical protein